MNTTRDEAEATANTLHDEFENGYDADVNFQIEWNGDITVISSTHDYLEGLTFPDLDDAEAAVRQYLDEVVAA